ncbi:hypothetical protein PS655_03083 [Pseudomonas fluorescens]|uniref:Uncharacterized protein n=1 Tax=Pseudomonas fluorescens TaxID=294 RepID=A0A5E6TTT0_PSEFL|nr:hypothetical protein PS655_03083 [Pseudomonas fluorescens]
MRGMDFSYDIFFWVHIRRCGNGHSGFRPYGGSLFPGAEKVTKKACSYVRPARWGSGFLRCGIDPGAAPTVCFAAPTPAVFDCVERSLRSHPRINPSTQPSDVALESRSKAGELTLGLLSGEKHGVSAFDLCWICPSSERRPPSPLPREREPICGLFRICVQRGIARRRTSSKHLDQSPLPLGEG